jgi:hypothetical protein
MKQTTKRLSSTIIALLLLVAAIVVFFDVIEPEYATVQSLRGQEESEQALLANEQQLAKQVQGIVSAYQSQSAQAQEVGLAMPIGQNNAEALAQIYGIAANSGLAIQTVAVSAQGSTVSAATAAPIDSSGASTTSRVGTVIKPKGSLSFQVTGVGSYGALKTFLQGLESNIRVFDVTGIGINPVASINGPSLVTTQDLFTYTITVVAYYQSS